MGLGQPVPSAPQPCPGSILLAQATSGCHHQLQFQRWRLCGHSGPSKHSTPLPKTPNPALHFALALGAACPPQKAEPCSDYGGKATAWAGVPGGLCPWMQLHAGGTSKGLSPARRAGSGRAPTPFAGGGRAGCVLGWRRRIPHVWFAPCREEPGGRRGPFPAASPRGTQPLEPGHHARRSWGCVDTDGPKSGGLGERERIWLGWAARVLLHAPGRSSGAEM